MTTTKPGHSPAALAAAALGGEFADPPQRDDMQNSIYLDTPAHQAALARHFGAPESTIVLSEIPLGWHPRREADNVLVPDLLVAFNIDFAAAVQRRGYAIDEQGKPPDLVLEIASIHTARNDYTIKRTGYARFEAAEYWRFDPTGGRFYPAGLAGDRLAGPEYDPIRIHRTDADRYWGHSDALNLDVCWEYGQLRWYDPAARRYLLTFDEEANGRIDAEVERLAAITDLQAERNAHAAEREFRAAVEAERDAAQERIRQLEAELRRRQNC